MTIFLRYGIFIITIVWVIDGCSISNRIKNKASESTFVLIVFADDTCRLTMNGVELSNLTREVRTWGNALSGTNYYDVCSIEGNNDNSIYINSMYPEIINPPLAFANLRSTVEGYYLTEYMYFTYTMTFPITDRSAVFFTKPNPYFTIDEFAEVQLSILNPDWESLNYSASFAHGFSFDGFRLTAVRGEATFYGAADIATHNILYKLVGTIIRTYN